MPRNIQPRKLDLDDPHDYNVYRHTAHILTPEIYDGGFPIFVRILKEMPAYKVGTIMRINSQNPHLVVSQDP